MRAAPEAVSELRGASGVCVSQMLPSTSVLKRQSQDGGCLRLGLFGPQGCIMGILSLRGHEKWGQHISGLEF